MAIICTTDRISIHESIIIDLFFYSLWAASAFSVLICAYFRESEWIGMRGTQGNAACMQLQLPE